MAGVRTRGASTQLHIYGVLAINQILKKGSERVGNWFLSAYIFEMSIKYDFHSQVSRRD